MKTIFHGYDAIATSAEVWAVLKARHGTQMGVFSSFSDPDGSQCGGLENGSMETVFGLNGADFPLMAAKTTWRIVPGDYKRHDEVTEYWLIVATKDEE